MTKKHTVMRPNGIPSCNVLLPLRGFCFCWMSGLASIERQERCFSLFCSSMSLMLHLGLTVENWVGNLVADPRRPEPAPVVTLGGIHWKGSLHDPLLLRP